MKKVIIPLIIVLAVSVAAIAVFVSNTKPVVPKTAQRVIKDDNKAQRYIIDIKYPEVMALGDKDARADINARIKLLIEAQIVDFKKQVADIGDFVGPEDSSSGLWMDYAFPTLTNDFVSLVLRASNYAAGAAHPNNYSIVFNYDVRSRSTVELGDLFVPGSSYLKVIADYAATDLTGQFGGPDAMSDPDWIKTGTAPTLENYQNFFADSETGRLVILFDPYQVAAYAAGGREVVIPTELISDILVPGGPLAPVL